MEAHGSREELKKLADRFASGKRRKHREGKMVSGCRLFALDREICDEKGKQARRVHFREFFKRPTGWTARYVPSTDVSAVEAVRFAFESIKKGDETWYERHAGKDDLRARLDGEARRLADGMGMRSPTLDEKQSSATSRD